MMESEYIPLSVWPMRSICSICDFDDKCLRVVSVFACKVGKAAATNSNAVVYLLIDDFI